MKNCYCHTCEKSFHYLGINSHRAAHRRRQEKCTITYTYGNTLTFAWRPNTGLQADGLPAGHHGSSLECTHPFCVLPSARKCAAVKRTVMKNTCAKCQYQRQPGQMDAGIPGLGTWCSNSKSPFFRMRVSDSDGCEVFAARGKKAPLGMRLKVKGMGLANRLLRKK